MQTQSDVLSDSQGVPVRGASVRVATYPADVTASLFDPFTEVGITNPIFSADGSFAFKAANGAYQITVSGNGIAPVKLAPFVLYDPADDPPVSIGIFAASNGATLVRHGTETVASELDALQLADYTALRAYAGARKSVYVTGYLASAAPSGITGMFVRDDSDTTTADNGGTVIVATNGKRWKRAQEQWSVAQYGVFPGASYGVTNCDAYARLVAAVRARGGNITILWPAAADKYYFSPRLNGNFSASTSYAWRVAVELVDVKNVYHMAAGARIHLDADPTWTRGNPLPANSGLDESVIQFRSSVAGGCDHVGIIGPCSITTDDTVDSLVAADGSAMGVSFRGCTNTLVAHVTAEYWGTDSFYYGPAYSDAFGGEQHLMIEPVSNRAHRQGISVVWNSHGKILGGFLHDTYGGSFGHGIDFEPDAGHTQEDWTLVGTRTKDNQRGACNFIRSSNIRFTGVHFDEQHASAAGCVYIDGDGVDGITFNSSVLKSLQPVLYVSGSASAAGGIDNIKFLNGCVLSTLGNNPASAAFMRINPFASTGMKIGTFTIKDSTISGNGGVTLCSDGVTKAKVRIVNSKWYLTNPAGAALSFQINSGTMNERLELDGVDMSVDATKTLATYSPVIISGSMVNCKLASHAAAIIQWVDYGAGRTDFEIGYNEFSTYSLYKGVVGQLSITGPGAVVQTKGTGDFQQAFRVLNGGRQRVLNYIATPAAFVDGQAPRDGDTTYNLGNSQVSVAVTSYTYSSELAKWVQNGFITKKGTTPNRPVTIATADIGVVYMDTTLAANGKSIMWNGSAWIDATGASV